MLSDGFGERVDVEKSWPAKRPCRPALASPRGDSRRGHPMELTDGPPCRPCCRGPAPNTQGHSAAPTDPTGSRKAPRWAAGSRL